MGKDDLFDVADFESIELTVYFENLSIDERVKDISKVSVLELGDQRISLTLPAWAGDAGHHVVVNIYRVTGPDRKETPVFTTTAKIESVLKAEDNMATATLALIQFDTKSWQDLNALFSKRQEEISRFFEMGKK